MNKHIHLALLPLAFAFSAWGGNKDTATTAYGQAVSHPAFAEKAQRDWKHEAIIATGHDVLLSPSMNESEAPEPTIGAVTIEVEQTPGRSSYLAICSEYEEEASGFNVDYDSCLLSTANNGPSTHRIELPKGVNRLIAVNWFYTETLNPSYSLWDKHTEGDIFTVK